MVEIHQYSTIVLFICAALELSPQLSTLLVVLIIVMKTSPLALAAVLGAAGSGIFVDAAEQLSAAAAGRSPPSQSLLAKLRTSLSNIKPMSQVSHMQGRGDEISRNRDDLKKPLSVDVDKDTQG